MPVTFDHFKTIIFCSKVPEEWATTKCHIVRFCNKHWNKINTIFLTFIFFQCKWAWKHRVDAQSRTTRSVAIFVVELQDNFFWNWTLMEFWYFSIWNNANWQKLGIFLLCKHFHELLTCLICTLIFLGCRRALIFLGCCLKFF